mmetsp:Transcript_82524/g.164527  ORF Transcript_82524/g.164527 Transcript_82524/m.164527 type:complete len:289 (-) Transcript_82524:1043-1909(-)
MRCYKDHVDRRGDDGADRHALFAHPHPLRNYYGLPHCWAAQDSLALRSLCRLKRSLGREIRRRVRLRLQLTLRFKLRAGLKVRLRLRLQWIISPPSLLDTFIHGHGHACWDPGRWSSRGLSHPHSHHHHHHHYHHHAHAHAHPHPHPHLHPHPRRHPHPHPSPSPSPSLSPSSTRSPSRSRSSSTLNPQPRPQPSPTPTPSTLTLRLPSRGCPVPPIRACLLPPTVPSHTLRIRSAISSTSCSPPASLGTSRRRSSCFASRQTQCAGTSTALTSSLSSAPTRRRCSSA